MASTNKPTQDSSDPTLLIHHAERLESKCIIHTLYILYCHDSTKEQLWLGTLHCWKMRVCSVSSQRVRVYTVTTRLATLTLSCVVAVVNHALGLPPPPPQALHHSPLIQTPHPFFRPITTPTDSSAHHCHVLLPHTHHHNTPRADVLLQDVKNILISPLHVATVYTCLKVFPWGYT